MIARRDAVRPFLLERLPAALAALAALAIMLAISHAQETAFYNYTLLADAWLHGRTWIDFPGAFIDAVPYHGHYHVVEAPMPAILLVPFAFFVGARANQTLLANVLGAICVYAAWRLCGRLGLSRGVTFVAIAFFFFGTSLFVSSTEGDVWLIAHVSAVCFSLLALNEVYGRQRPWLVALFAMGAMLSRYPLGIAIPFYLAMLLARKPRLDVAAIYAAAIVPAAALLSVYNLANWGNPWASGYAVWYRIMDPRYHNNPSMLSIANLAPQLNLYLQRQPQFVPRAPWIVPPRFGFGIVYSSLPFLYAVVARLNRDTALLWLVTVATAIPALFYYDSGGVQYGVRHALDFEPFLFVLLVTALRNRPSKIVLGIMGAFTAFGVYESLVWLLWPGVR